MQLLHHPSKERGELELWRSLGGECAWKEELTDVLGFDIVRIFISELLRMNQHIYGSVSYSLEWITTAAVSFLFNSSFMFLFLTNDRTFKGWNDDDAVVLGLCAPDYHFLGTQTLPKPQAVNQWIGRKNSQLNKPKPRANPTGYWQRGIGLGSHI